MQDLTLRREYFEKHWAWIGKYFSSGNIFSSGATAKRISVSLWIYKQEIMEREESCVLSVHKVTNITAKMQSDSYSSKEI